MADDPALYKLGIQIQELMAACLGGLSSAFVRRLHTPLEVTGSMFVGMTTGYYLCEFAAPYLGTSPITASYLIGVAGFPLCLGIITYAKYLFPKQDKEGSSDVD